MKPLYIEPTEHNPTVVLDKDKGVFKFSGRSLPEDASKFFDPIQEWVGEYVKNPNPETIIEFKLDYFNSSSARKFVNILIELETVMKTDNKVKVIWYYKREDKGIDEVMKERGEEIEKIIELPFEIKEYR